jgi:hypothetical protein
LVRTIVNIIGSNLGVDKNNVAIRVGGVDCVVLTGQDIADLGSNFQSLNCTVPPVGSLGINIITATRFGIESLRNPGKDEFYIFNPVSVQSLSPIGGKEGTIITIKGISLGEDANYMNIYVDKLIIY